MLKDHLKLHKRVILYTQIMPTIRFAREGRDVNCQIGENLREVALREGLELYGFKGKIGNCGGYGQCRTCTISIESGGSKSLSPTTQVESDLLKKSPKNWRLACQALVQGSAVVLTRPQSPPKDLKKLIDIANSVKLPN